MARPKDFDKKRLEYWLTEREVRFVELNLLASGESLQQWIQSIAKEQIKRRRARQQQIKFEQR
jgi:hypothetical protein